MKIAELHPEEKTLQNSEGEKPPEREVREKKSPNPEEENLEDLHSLTKEQNEPSFTPHPDIVVESVNEDSESEYHEDEDPTEKNT